MPLHLIPSLVFFCLVQSVTPGPANLSTLAVALQHGKAAALRHWHGIVTGFGLISLASVAAVLFLGGALGEAVRYLPYLGSAYLLYLAARMAFPRKAREGEKEKTAFRPSFLSGFLVQMTNVKIMIFCMTVLSGYVLPYTSRPVDLLVAGVLLALTCPLANLVWLFAGTGLQSVFAGHEKLMNGLIALSLIYCAVSLLL